MDASLEEKQPLAPSPRSSIDLSPTYQQPKTTSRVAVLRAMLAGLARKSTKTIRSSVLAVFITLVILAAYSELSQPGLDSLVASPSVLALEKTPSRRPPTIFNLEPPESIRRHLELAASFCFHDQDPSEVPGIAGDIERAFGGHLPSASSYPEDMPYTLQDTNQFALSAMLTLRTNHRAGLVDVKARPTLENADYLLLSLDTALFQQSVYCLKSKKVPASSSSSGVERRTLDWLRLAVKEYGKRRAFPSLILPLSRIGRDYSQTILEVHLEREIMGDVVFVGIEKEMSEDSPDPLETFLQMPYPTIFSLPLNTTDQKSEGPAREALADWLLSRNRTHLVSFAGKSPEYEGGPFNGFAVRRQISATLAGYANNETVSVLIPAKENKHTFIPSAHLAMLQSTFCLQPPGDSATRKGFWESILMGCIPVVFRRETYARVWDGIDWDEIAVVVEEEDFLESQADIVRTLEGVSQRDVKRRQRDIATLAARVQYGMPTSGEGVEWGGDAFGMLLRRLDAIKRRGSLRG